MTAGQQRGSFLGSLNIIFSCSVTKVRVSSAIGSYHQVLTGKEKKSVAISYIILSVFEIPLTNLKRKYLTPGTWL